MLGTKMYPLPLIWLEPWNHTIKRMIQANSPKNRSKLYHVRYKSHTLIGQKWQNTFRWTHKGNFLVDTEQAGKQASKQASKQVHSRFPLSDRNFSGFWVVISVEMSSHFFKFIFKTSQYHQMKALNKRISEWPHLTL